MKNDRLIEFYCLLISKSNKKKIWKDFSNMSNMRGDAISYNFVCM